MRVQAIANERNFLKGEELLNHQNNCNLSEENLEVGNTYFVFGIVFQQGIPWYLISEEDDDAYPKMHIATFFEILDPQIPKNWMYCSKHLNVPAPALLPEKWAEDFTFLEKLVDEDCDALEYFQKLKRES